MKKTRRSLLAAGAMAFGGGCTSMTLSSEGHPSEKDFPFSDNFKSAQWSVGPKLSVTTSAKGKMDGFGVFHEYGDTYEDALRFYEAPRHGGEVLIDFKSLLDENEPPFPNRNFELWAYTGSFGFIKILDEKLEAVPIGAPKSYVMPEYFQNETES